MTTEQARECADIVANAYGMGQRRVAWYADQFERFPAGPTAQFLEGWVQREKVPPTIAVVRAGVQQQLETLGTASPTFAPRSERTERLITWRSLLEDPTSNPREREDARDRIAWMDPPVTQSEWREARTVADARHAARNQQRLSEGRPPRPARPPLSWPQPPPADPQPILSRAAQAAGMRALRDGLERRLDRQAMTAHVLGTVRAAERAHAQDEAW
jgi:hypothetical protein